MTRLFEVELFRGPMDGYRRVVAPEKDGDAPLVLEFKQCRLASAQDADSLDPDSPIPVESVLYLRRKDPEEDGRYQYLYLPAEEDDC